MTTPTPSSRSSNWAWSCGDRSTISRPGGSRRQLHRRRRFLAWIAPVPLTSAASLALSCGRSVAIGRSGGFRATPSPAAAASWVSTTSSHCAQSFLLGLPLWSGVLGRPGSSRATPSPAAAASWATTIRHTAHSRLLGLTLGSLGEHQQARQLQSDAFTRSRRILGKDHPTHCAQPPSSASPWDRWVSTSKPASSRATPSPAAAESWATTTPTPLPLQAGSPPTSAN